MNLLRIPVLILVLCSTCSRNASGSTLVSYSGIGGGHLWKIDQNTGTPSLLSLDLGFRSISDLAGLPGDTTIWSVGVRDNNAPELLRFSPATGTVVASIDLATGMNTLAIDPTTGDFYGTSLTNLYHISPITGATTLVGSTGQNVGNALGFDLAGNLFGVAHDNQLVSINKSTGATSLVATLAAQSMEDIAVKPETGIMYGIGYGPDYGLYQINTANGTLTKLGASLSRPTGLAFADVPEPAFGIYAFIALLSLTIQCRWSCWFSKAQ